MKCRRLGDHIFCRTYYDRIREVTGLHYLLGFDERLKD